MRILLDEMYSASIAEGLRTRGHDALAVVERLELRSVPDPELFAAAQSERQAVVTENMADYIEIANGYDVRGTAHHGVVLVHPRRFPRSVARTVGAIVTALDALAAQHGSDEPTSLRHWL